jgi:hypothetical protein
MPAAERGWDRSAALAIVPANAVGRVKPAIFMSLERFVRNCGSVPNHFHARGLGHEAFPALQPRTVMGSVIDCTIAAVRRV